MEKKTKYRIVGISAIAALAAAAIFLLQKNNEFKTETVAIKAPPFRDKVLPTQSTEAPNTDQTSAPVEQPAEVGNNSIQLDTEDVITTVHPSIVNDVQDESPKGASQESDTKVTQGAHEVNKPLPDKEPVVQKAALDAEYVKKVSAQLASLEKENKSEIKSSDNGVVHLNKSAWVIQIGSFKYTANALRMVNELRANGYRAFIQKTSTHLGENTRVFVGPENKQNDAFALAMRLENDLHIHGIVISYKPLAL